MDGLLTFFDSSLEEEFCKNLCEARRHRGAGIGQDAARIFVVLLVIAKRIKRGTYGPLNQTNMTVSLFLPLFLILLQLYEWRTHWKRSGTWRYRIALSLVVAMMTFIGLMRWSYTFTDTLENPSRITLFGFWMAGSGISVLHVSAFTTLVPFRWSLLQQSTLALLFLDPAERMCSSQPSLQQAISRLHSYFHLWRSEPPDTDNIRLCVKITQVSLIMLGYIPSVYFVYWYQLKLRRAFLASKRPALLSHPPRLAIKNVLLYMISPIAIFAFYIAASSHLNSYS